MNNEKIIAQQNSDQAWAAMRQFYNEVGMIADNGPDEETHPELVKGMAQLIRGEMTLRMLDSQNL